MRSVLEKSYDINLNDSSEIIKFYEENRLYFDNYDKITDIEGIENIILIKQKYCEAIERKNHFTDAALVLEHIFVLLDKLKGNSDEYEFYYERALFYDGVILGRKKKYKESNTRFKRLIIIDPKNENYHDWFDTNTERIINKKLDILYYIIPVILGLTLITKDKYVGKFYSTIEISLVVIMIGIYIYQRYIVSLIREKRRKRTNR